MAYAVKEREVLKRALEIVKREFSPVDDVRFLSAISARRGDAAKELRKLRDVVTEEELDKALKKEKRNSPKGKQKS